MQVLPFMPSFELYPRNSLQASYTDYLLLLFLSNDKCLIPAFRLLAFTALSCLTQPRQCEHFYWQQLPLIVRGNAVYHTRAIECVIEDSGVEAVYWSSHFERCNVLANGEVVLDTPRGCNCSLADLGKYAAPCLVTEDCKPGNQVFMDIQQASTTSATLIPCNWIF